MNIFRLMMDTEYRKCVANLKVVRFFKCLILISLPQKFGNFYFLFQGIIYWNQPILSPCFNGVVESQVEVQENQNNVGTWLTRECFHSYFEFSQVSTNVSVYDFIETPRNYFPFLLENIGKKKGKSLFILIIKC